MERMTEFTDDMKYIIDLEEENKKLNKAKDLFNKRDMTGKDEFLEELRDLLRD